MENLDPPVVRFTPTTITTPEELHEEFTRIRTVGYALDREEHEPGIVCLAIPLFPTSRTRPEGAISITAVAQRIPLDYLEESVERARATIRQHLGEVLL